MVTDTISKRYKQTEIGVIPKDWKLITIGDHFDFKNGLNKSKEYFGYGIPIVNYMDVYNNQGITVKDIQGKVSLTKEEIRNYQVRKGDVFFTRTSETVEEIGIASVMLEEVKDTVFSGFILRARPKSDFFDLKFKKYCFGNSVVRKQITSTSSYTTRALTNGRFLSGVVVPAPTVKKEQHAIAEALSEADTLSQQLDRLITKKKDIKKGAMQELLTERKRLHGYSQEWEIKTITEIALKLKAGGTPSRSVKRYWKGEIPFVLIDDITRSNKFLLKSEESITSIGLNNSSAWIVPTDSILLSMYASLGELVINKIEVTTNQAIIAIIPKEGFDLDFLYYNIKFNQRLFEKLVSQTTQKNLNKEKISNFELKFPKDFEEQKAIAQVLSEMDEDIEELKRKRDKYKMIKEGMMQQLLTGRIRLKWN